MYISNFCMDVAVRKHKCSNRFCIYKYIDEHNNDIENANSSHQKFSIKFIAWVKILRRFNKLFSIIFIVLQAIENVWRVVSKKKVWWTVENGYSCLQTFSNMMDCCSSYCVIVNKDSHRFLCYWPLVIALRDFPTWEG